MKVALTAHPVSSDYRRSLETALGTETAFLSITELNALPPAKRLERLFSLRGAHILLPLESARSSAVIPVLQALAAVSGAGRIELIHHDLSRERVALRDVVRGLVGLASATVTSASGAYRCRRELVELVHSPRAIIRKQTRRRAVYLNANYWVGAKAGGSVGHVAGVIGGLLGHGYMVDHVAVGERGIVDQRAAFHPVVPPKTFGLPFELNHYRLHDLTVSKMRELPMEDYDFLYQRFSLANYAGAVLSRERRIPLILEYNGSDAWIAKHWGRPLHFHNLAMLAEETCLRNADLIVVVSEVLRDELVERGIEPSRIVCYPNCIDPVVFDPERFDSQDRDVLRRELGIAPEAVVATFVGTFGQWHGADVLANVICKVFGRSDNWAEKARLHFLLVGDGWRLPMVRQALSAGGCTGHHALTGLVPQLDTPRILAASDICLSPHVANEDATAFIGSPTKLFEYMAMAKAIVASDLDQIGQVLHNSLRVEALPDGPPAETDDRLAVLTPPGDADGVARAIRFLVEYPEWQSLLARNARREALSLFTWDRHVQKILAAYERSYAG